MLIPNTRQWGRFEQAFYGTVLYANPFQDVSVTVRFTTPGGRERTVDAFWNGGTEWRVRFMPDEIGTWSFVTVCSDEKNHGLHGQRGSFTCSEPSGTMRFDQHGPVRLSADRRYLTHADGTPFFWIADTAWNGHLCSTPDEWAHYLNERKRQQFTVVQWVATQWISAPDGDWTGELPFSGHERIQIHPAFFQRLDQKITATNNAGLLNAVVMLWAASWSSHGINARNPGFILPDDQMIRLARYMLARWGAYPAVWFINGDGDYRGEKAERWKHIGRAVFSDPYHAPVSLHPGGMQWVVDEFRHEQWMDIVGYQSGHGDDENTFDWLVNGPPSVDWKNEPARPFINLELPYEDHIAYQSRKKHDDHSVRRATYWSLLVAPTAGVTYGGHGIWGWDDGSAPPIGHPTTGIPLAWREALHLPAAEQMKSLSAFFNAFAWWKLIPAPQLLANQPGEQTRAMTITVAQSDEIVVAYLPANEAIALHLSQLPPEFSADWFDPRTGERHNAVPKRDGNVIQFTTPEKGDWLLQIRKPAAPESVEENT
jgi:hypothetical protein